MSLSKADESDGRIFMDLLQIKADLLLTWNNSIIDITGTVQPYSTSLSSRPLSGAIQAPYHYNGHPVSSSTRAVSDELKAHFDRLAQERRHSDVLAI